MTTMPAVKSKRPARRPGKAVAKPKAVKRPAKRSLACMAQPEPVVDMSRREAFKKMSLAERRRRNQAFIDALAPAFADYSSDDFRADQRREAERDA